MSKYRSVRVDGYHSKKEAKRSAALIILQRAGVITDLQEQVKFELIPTQRTEDGKTERSVSYIADFVYKEDGKLIVEDSKGFKTTDYIIKRKLMLFIHGITVRET